MCACARAIMHMRAGRWRAEAKIPLELGSQVVVSHLTSVWDPNSGPLQEECVILITKPILQSHSIIFEMYLYEAKVGLDSPYRPRMALNSWISVSTFWVLGHRYASPDLPYVVLGIEPRVLWVLSKQLARQSWGTAKVTCMSDRPSDGGRLGISKK